MALGFGQLADALRPGRTIQHFFNLPLAQELQDRSVQNISDTRRQSQETANQFSRDVADALGKIRSLDQTDRDLITGLIGRINSGDPMNDLRTLRTENLSALQGLSDVLGNVGRRQQSLSLAGLGLGGGAGSSYQDILNQSRVNTAIAPIAGSIFNNLSSDAEMINRSRLNNISQALGLVDYRAQVPVRGLNLRALPVSLRGLIDENYLRGLDTIGNTSRNNTAGFEYRQTPFAAGGHLLDGLVDTALSAYTGGLGGGGGAPAGGSNRMFGVGGQGTPPIYSNAMLAMQAGRF